MTITIADLIKLFECPDTLEFCIFDNHKIKVIWKGDGDEIPDKFLHEKVTSINIIDEDESICINIH